MKTMAGEAENGETNGGTAYRTAVKIHRHEWYVSIRSVSPDAPTAVRPCNNEITGRRRACIPGSPISRQCGFSDDGCCSPRWRTVSPDRNCLVICLKYLSHLHASAQKQYPQRGMSSSNRSYPEACSQRRRPVRLCRDARADRVEYLSQ